MSRNRLTAIEDLAALGDLESLSLADNKVTVVAGLEGLGRLKRLDLSGNPLTDFDAGLAQVAEGCEVGLVNCGLSARQKRALKKEHGKRLQLKIA